MVDGEEEEEEEEKKCGVMRHGEKKNKCDSKSGCDCHCEINVKSDTHDSIKHNKIHATKAHAHATTLYTTTLYNCTQSSLHPQILPVVWSTIHVLQ